MAIDSFRERENQAVLVDIEATIICEKESHQPDRYRKGRPHTEGDRYEERGQEMEEFLGVKVNLKLWVKVKDRWRDSEFLIRNFGFDKRDLQ